MCSPLVASSEQIRAGRHVFFKLLQDVVCRPRVVFVEKAAGGNENSLTCKVFFDIVIADR